LRKFSKKIQEQVLEIIEYIKSHEKFSDFHIKKLKLKNLNIMPYIWAHIMKGDAHEDIIDEKINMEVPKLPLNGNDLKGLNIKPRKFKKILDKLEDKWINSNYSLSKEDLMKIADKI
jgi:hypothetical protein